MVDLDKENAYLPGTYDVRAKGTITVEPMEFVCPKCDTLCLKLWLTESKVSFQIECHICGNRGVAKNLYAGPLTRAEKSDKQN